MRKAIPICLLLLSLATASPTGATDRGTQAAFASPGDAACALLEAIAGNDYAVFLSVAGDRMAAFWNGEDAVRGALNRLRFADAARDHGFATHSVSPDKVMLYVPGVADLFPAPLVKNDSGWQFDAEAGATILKAQRVVSNEAAVIELCSRLREAEFTQFDGPNGGTAYTQKVRSTSGQHDGLFWNGDDDEESPLGPVFAAAAYSEQEPGAETRPWFGYYFRILAPNGSTFAFIAWPAEYGTTGARSFLITQSGDVYRRDLGRGSARFVSRLTRIPSLRGWTRLVAAKDSE